jgi:hypothetical protein
MTHFNISIHSISIFSSSSRILETQWQQYIWIKRHRRVNWVRQNVPAMMRDTLPVMKSQNCTMLGHKLLEQLSLETFSFPDVPQSIVILTTVNVELTVKLFVTFVNKSLFWQKRRRKTHKHCLLITWLNGVADVNDGIIAVVLRSGRCLVDNDVGEERFFADDFFGEINSVQFDLDEWIVRQQKTWKIMRKHTQGNQL